MKRKNSTVLETYDTVESQRNLCSSSTSFLKMRFERVWKFPVLHPLFILILNAFNGTISVSASCSTTVAL